MLVMLMLILISTLITPSMGKQNSVYLSSFVVIPSFIQNRYQLDAMGLRQRGRIRIQSSSLLLSPKVITITRPQTAPGRFSRQWQQHTYGDRSFILQASEKNNPGDYNTTLSERNSVSIRSSNRSDRLSTISIFLLLPLLSLLLPAMLSSGMYVTLALMKRVYVYLLAGSIVVIGSIRGANDSPGLGGRIIDLTSEILPFYNEEGIRLSPSPPLNVSPTLGDDKNGSEFDTVIEKKTPATNIDSRFEELRALDAVAPATQSAFLPVIVAGSLATSVLLLRIQSGDDWMGLFTDGSDTSANSAFFSPFVTQALQSVAEALQGALPVLVGLSNVAVVGLFVRAELDRSWGAWFVGDTEDEGENRQQVQQRQDAITAVLTIILVSVAYLAPPSLAWPVRNLVCLSLGIAVSRAAQIPRLGAIVGALSALVIYDVYSVGTMLVDLGNASLSSGGDGGDAASSVMGAVAMSKVGAGGLGGADSIKLSSTDPIGAVLTGWQPGLLEVRLRGRVTDLLGLGDAVFPSLLSTFALRYDLRNRESESTTAPSYDYFGTSIIGYAAGCLACETAPGIGSSGLPALLFIIPLMITSVLGLSLAKGEFGSLWEFDPAAAIEEEPLKRNDI